MEKQTEMSDVQWIWTMLAINTPYSIDTLLVFLRHLSVDIGIFGKQICTRFMLNLTRKITQYVVENETLRVSSIRCTVSTKVQLVKDSGLGMVTRRKSCKQRPERGGQGGVTQSQSSLLKVDLVPDHQQTLVPASPSTPGRQRRWGAHSPQPLNLTTNQTCLAALSHSLYVLSQPLWG